MKEKTLKVKIILYSISLFFLLPKPAYAYLDPGNGSYLFQLIIAGLLASMFFVKTVVKKIKEFFQDIRQRKITIELDENA